MAGAIGALAALAVDLAMAWWMGKHDPVITAAPWILGAGFGALAAGLLSALETRLESGPVSLSRSAATAAACLWGGALFERTERLGLDEIGPLGAALLGLLGLAVYGFFILCLARLRHAPPLGGWASGWRDVPALILGALTVAAGLAVNLHLVRKPLEPTALLLDLGLVAGSFSLAAAGRIAALRRPGIGAGVLAGLPVLIFWGAVTILRPADPVPREPLAPAPETDRSHLVLVTVDTLRQDVFRQVIEETPEGRAFEAAVGPAAWLDEVIAVAPWTAPTVASLLTGLHPAEHGFTTPAASGHGSRVPRLSDSTTTLAEVLRRSGYFTAAIVTNPYLHPEAGLAQGFAAYQWLHPRASRLPSLRFLSRLGWLSTTDAAYEPAATVRRHFERQLRRRAPDRPAFLWAHFMDPHMPHTEHRDLAAEDPLVAHAPRPGASIDESLYRREVRYLCRELTRLVDSLKREGIWNESLFVLISDHGEMFLSDGHGVRFRGRTLEEGHSHALYDEVLRVPGLVRPPGGLPSPLRLEALASQVDLFPTVLDLLGLEGTKPTPDALSWAPWLTGGAISASPERRVLSGDVLNGPDRLAVRSRRWKLIRSPSGEPARELYDLSLDPTEQRNLAAAEEEPLASLEAQLLTAREQLAEAAAGAGSEDLEAEDLDPEAERQLRALGYLN